uniref:Uncharacterized protein n=1 Tax=Ascaris lumbricoides TaxID=6252 RepID=A0A0M3IFF4_ASCLU
MPSDIYKWMGPEMRTTRTAIRDNCSCDTRARISQLDTRAFALCETPPPGKENRAFSTGGNASRLQKPRP